MFFDSDSLFYTSDPNDPWDEDTEEIQLPKGKTLKEYLDEWYPPEGSTSYVVECQCGAKHTTNPNLHLRWCPLWKDPMRGK